jgi:hypothetical protein
MNGDIIPIFSIVTIMNEPEDTIITFYINLQQVLDYGLDNLTRINLFFYFIKK